MHPILNRIANTATALVPCCGQSGSVFSQPHHQYAPIPDGNPPPLSQGFLARLFRTFHLHGSGQAEHRISDPVAQAIHQQLQEGLERLNRHFLHTENESAARAEAETIADEYNAFRQGKDQAPVTGEAREFLVELIMMVKDVHSLIPYGRANVPVRNEDVLGENGASSMSERQKKEFNLDASWAKDYLESARRFLMSKLRDRRHVALDRVFDAYLKSAAVSVLAGSSTCGGYTGVLLTMAAQRYAPLIEEGTLKLSVLRLTAMVESDRIVNSTTNGEPLNHVYCKAEFTDGDGQSHAFVVDPWPEMNCPILLENSKYSLTTERVTTGAVANAHGTDYRGLIEGLMKNAAPYLKQCRADESVRARRMILEFAHSEMDVTKAYSLWDDHRGLLSREALNMTDGFTPTLKRRPSLVNALNSPLVQLERTLGHSSI
jgi:hypothetical protein